MAEQSEREQFEAWMSSEERDAPLYRRDMKGSERIGEYCHHIVQLAWKSWQARAALSAGCADGGKESASEAQDAERYRWLKGNCFDTEDAGDGDAFGYPSLHFESDELQCHNADSLDSAIDAAIAGEKQG